MPHALSLRTVSAWITQNSFYVFNHSRQSVHELHRTVSTYSITQDSQCMNYTEQILRVLSLKTVSAWITQNSFYVFYHSRQSVHELHRTDSMCSITQDSLRVNDTKDNTKRNWTHKRKTSIFKPIKTVYSLLALIVPVFWKRDHKKSHVVYFLEQSAPRGYQQNRPSQKSTQSNMKRVPLTPHKKPWSPTFDPAVPTLTSA